MISIAKHVCVKFELPMMSLNKWPYFWKNYIFVDDTTHDEVINLKTKNKKYWVIYAKFDWGSKFAPSQNR